MADYLVFNDQTGDFVAEDQIVAVVPSDDYHAAIVVKSGDRFYSPFKPRELLRRLTIMRFKRENDDSTASPRRTSSSAKANQRPDAVEPRL